jgi:hypothetical protein
LHPDRLFRAYSISRGRFPPGEKRIADDRPGIQILEATSLPASGPVRFSPKYCSLAYAAAAKSKLGGKVKEPQAK